MMNRFLSFRLLLAAMLVWAPCLLAAPGSAQEKTLTLGPGMLTYPELARALSTPEQPITCAPKVQHRAALVYLKNRSRADVLRLLAQALDVQFVVPRPDTQDASTTPPGLVMQADVGVTRREERWRKDFADRISEYLVSIENHNQELLRRHQHKSPDEIKAEYEAINEELRPLYEAQPDGNFEGAVKAKAERLSNRQLDLMQVQSLRSSEPREQLTWAASQNVFPALRVADAVNEGYVKALLPMSLLPKEAVRQSIDMFPQNKGHEGSAIVAVLRLTVGAHRINFEFDGDVVDSKGSHLLSLQHGFDNIYAMSNHQTDTSLADDVFEGIWMKRRAREGYRWRPLSSGARTWLKEQQAATRQFLASERAGTPLKDARVTVADVLSQFVGVYQQERDAEVLMELHPITELIDRRNWLREEMRSLRQLQKRMSSWTFTEADGVLVVKNQLAFLDRQIARPVAALVELTRTLEKQNAAKGGGKPSGVSVAATDEPPSMPLPIGLLEAYAEPAQKLRQWTFSTFRGVRLAELDGVLPSLLVWETLSDEERAQLRQMDRFPLAKVDAKTLRRVADWLAAYPRGYPQRTLSDSVAFLRQCYLTRKLEIRHPGQYVYRPAEAVIDWGDGSAEP